MSKRYWGLIFASVYMLCPCRASTLEMVELGDVVWRTLSLPIDYHGAIHRKWDIPLSPHEDNNRGLVEMEGPALRIRNLSLEEFKEASIYYLAPRSLVGLDRDTRKAIIEVAEQLRTRNPQVEYVDNYLGNYIDTVDEYSGLLQITDIVAMRSDAFVEFCYAYAGRPIIRIYSLNPFTYNLPGVGGVDIRGNPNRFDDAASLKAEGVRA